MTFRAEPRSTPRATALSLALLIACMGCGDDSLQTRVLNCASLPAAESSPNDQLKRFVAQVRERGQAPDQWDPLPAPAGDDAAKLLAEVLGEPVRLRLTPVVEGFFDEGVLSNDLANQRGIDAFLTKNSQLVGAIQQAADSPAFSFDCHHELGFFARLEDLDRIELAVRIHLARASWAIREADAKEALREVRRAMRWCERLSRAPRIEPRVLAASLRAETLDVVHSLFDTGLFAATEAEEIYGDLRGALGAWPKDASSLAGDRAVVMHTYEAIRMGMQDRILTGRELAQLEEEGMLEAIQGASPTDLDQDEVNYLKAMEQLIESSDTMPYFERLAAYEAATRAAKEPPALYAHRLFLVEAVDALRAMAHDRTRCEAWCIVLAQAAELTLPPFRVNPVSGAKYSEIRSDGRVSVETGDPAWREPSCPVF